MRLAFFSPLNADKSGPWASTFTGLQDHNEELLASLGEIATVDLVVDGYQPSTPWIRERFRVLGPEDFLKCHAQYTAAIYHIANNFHMHRYMIPCMRKVPGILVLHDCCLEYLALGLTLRQGDFRTLRRIIQETYGDEATGLATKLLLGGGNPGSLVFAKPFIEMSKGVIVYNEFARQCVAGLSPRKMVRTIPLGVPVPADVPGVGALRERYGFAPDHFIVASANSLSHTKRLNLVLEAVAAVRERYPQIRLLIVGGGSPGAEARALIQKLQLEAVIKETGYVSNEDYRNLVHLSDVAVDMRYPSGGETSASLSRAFALGKPAIVSAQGSFQNLPDGVCLKIPVGEGEVQRLENALAMLIEDSAVKLRMGEAALEFARNTLSLENAARQCVEFVREVCASETSVASDYFGDTGASAVERLAVAGLYNFCRAAYFFRHHGLAPTWRRMQEETGLK